jgi:hypothetical protein
MVVLRQGSVDPTTNDAEPKHPVEFFADTAYVPAARLLNVAVV